MSSTRLIISVRFPQNSTPHPSNFFSELGSLMEPTRVFAHLEVAGGIGFAFFLPEVGCDAGRE
jgi:hypothetical protein